ncbi:glutathione S-transferase family protein [Dasania sp. GY-MA-18]|uniref:Glutathione S-transferase family protein n=1 Tax=Dasania phycosphaerae TaxID=2950436 RepID=A0A9J6RN08_9GAMM|nr:MULTISPECIES: glutathione S-transferase family protein [Dasania]MCR8923119.1 glutathione S-transferase family protein [Dasania sp. GY-MA-18]MCZ0865551.1 glutathione S-transferase family protein [Dasania phycosphaerae]MCZ0869276.1 glutathione S-transferase family protein [Dasania phycosphaerae]
MLTYYGAKDSCSIPAQIILEMSGQPYENVYLSFDQGLPEHYLSLNPTGQVPTLVEDEQVFTQCVGITTYLADKWPQLNMTPALDSPQRGHYLKWMHFLNSSMHEAYLRVYYPNKYAVSKQACDEVREMAKQAIDKHYDIVNSWLEPGPYCLGETIQACDLYLATLISWQEDREALFTRLPRLQLLFEKVTTHPVANKVFVEHGVAL